MSVIALDFNPKRSLELMQNLKKKQLTDRFYFNPTKIDIKANLSILWGFILLTSPRFKKTRILAERIKEKVKWGRLVSPVDNYLVGVVKRPHFTFSLIPSADVAHQSEDVVRSVLSRYFST